MSEAPARKRRSLLARRPTPASQIEQRVAPRLSSYAGAVGLAILAGLILLTLLPGLLAPYDPTETVGRPLQEPDGDFLLGTNDIGQDLLSELIWGTRASLSTGIVVGFLAVLTGTIVGLVAGYTSGLPGAVLMRLTDLTLVLPFLPLVILLSAYLGPSQGNVILILAFVSWAGSARLIRSRVLSLLSEPYIEAALAVGCTRQRILVSHIWPGVRFIALVQLLLVASAAILAEASLSFLGLGDPSAKSWGTMLYFARASGAFLTDAWRWWVLPAGLMITLTVLSLALIGYTAEKVLEPRLRR
jgi:ABC-type dipeptide/oligopeptide/nickel transport system permease subunit